MTLSSGEFQVNLCCKDSKLASHITYHWDIIFSLAKLFQWLLYVVTYWLHFCANGWNDSIFFNFFVIHAISLLQNLCCTSCKISEVYLKVDKFYTNFNIMFVSLRAREYMHFVLQRNLGRVAHLSIVFPNCHCVRKEKWTVVWTSLYGLDISAMLYQSIVFLISWVICLLTCCKCYLTVPIVSIESLYVIWLSFNVHMQRSTCLLLVYLIVGKRGWVHATPS